MKSFRQFILEGADPDVSWRQFLKRVKKKAGLGANDDLPKGEAERLKKLFDDQYEKPTTKKGTGISDIEGTDELGPEKRGRSSIKDRENTSRIYDQEKLDQRKLAAQERTKFKKTTKAERAKHIGKPTHISKKHGVKYTPPTKLSKAEQELIDAGKFRRAKKSTNPEKISDVKKKIDDLDARNKKYQSREYSTSTQAQNRYGGKSVQDSRGRWVPDPVQDGKPIKEPGKSARRRTPTKSVEQLKKEIESRTDGRQSNKPPKSTTTRVKGSTFKGNKPLGKPSPVPGGTTPSKPTPVDFQTKRSTPKDFKPRASSTPKFDSSYNPKAPDSSNPNRIDQREVSKRASKFTKDTNTARIEKLSKGRVKIDYGMPKPEKGEILRSVDNRPKTKTQLSPDTLRSTNPKSDINTTYDKSKASREASRTFKDMATDSRKKLSSKGPIGRSKEYVKNLTNKISRSLGFKSKVKSTTTPKVTKVPKNKLFQRLNITRKKGLRNLKGTGPGVYYGLSAYTRQRDAGAGIPRSLGGTVTSTATSGLTWKYASKYLNKLAKPKGLVGNLVNYGLSGALAWKVGDETLKAYDSTLGPTKGMTPPTKKKDDKKVLLPFGGKKKKKLDFKNYTFSLSGDSRKNNKDKKDKK